MKTIHKQRGNRRGVALCRNFGLANTIDDWTKVTCHHCKRKAGDLCAACLFLFGKVTKVQYGHQFCHVCLERLLTAVFKHE